MDKNLAYVFVILLLVIPAYLMGSVLVSAYCSDCFTNGRYVDYRMIGRITTITPDGNKSSYTAAAVARYTFTGIVGNEITGYYEITTTNDTRGIIFGRQGSEGRRVNINISLDQKFNASKLTVYIDPSSLPSNGYIHYVNITNDRSKVSRLEINAYYDPSTGIMLNYTMKGEINNTVNGMRAIFEMKYKLIHTNIPEIMKLLKQTTTPPHQTTTSKTGSEMTTRNRYSENAGGSFITYALILITVFVGLLALVFTRNILRKH